MKFEIIRTVKLEQVRDSALKEQLVTEARAEAQASGVGQPDQYTHGPDFTVSPNRDGLDDGPWFDVTMSWDRVGW